jgi:hypothetical protein
MTAAAAMRRAYDEGVHITCEGENLVLRASNPPAAEVIDLLKQHKADIISLLATQSVDQDSSEWAKGGEGGVSVVRKANEAEAAPQAKESDSNPNLPWPLPGETLLPGWGTRVSMEYRLRTASEVECLEWANETWQLKLVARARGYSQKWVDQILLNRTRWNYFVSTKPTQKNNNPPRPTSNLELSR